MSPFSLGTAALRRSGTDVVEPWREDELREGLEAWKGFPHGDTRQIRHCLVRGHGQVLCSSVFAHIRTGFIHVQLWVLGAAVADSDNEGCQRAIPAVVRRLKFSSRANGHRAVSREGEDLISLEGRVDDVAAGERRGDPEVAGVDRVIGGLIADCLRKRPNSSSEMETYSSVLPRPCLGIRLWSSIVPRGDETNNE